MKKLLFIVFSILNSILFAQNIDDDLQKREKRVDSLTIVLKKENIENENISFLQDARKALKSSVSEVLQLENFNNKQMQKVLLNPLQDYYSAFDYESNGKKGNSLRFGFEFKEDFIQHYKIVEVLLLGKISDKQYDVLIEYQKKKLKLISDYIDRNLKRLGITKEQYENLSDKDIELLEKNFIY